MALDAETVEQKVGENDGWNVIPNICRVQMESDEGAVDLQNWQD